jgi:hypothetical protein
MMQRSEDFNNVNECFGEPHEKEGKIGWRSL